MTWNNLSKYTDLGLLIFRLGFGLGFLFFHGYDKLMGGPEAWANLGGAMSMFGIGFGHTIFGFLAAFAESIGGIMIAAGLYYRPIMALLAGTMFVATIRHMISGQGTPAHAFKNFFVLLGLMPLGPGKYSVDALMANKRNKTAVPV